MAVPTGPFTSTGHRSRVLSLEALGKQGGKAIRGQRELGGGQTPGCAGTCRAELE